VQFIEHAHKLEKKVVYVGFGSIVISDPKAMTRCVVEAVVKSGVHAILSKGWSDRLHVKTADASDPEEPLPEQIYPISSIPHSWLFKRIDAACHHGGAGTTSASLRGTHDKSISCLDINVFFFSSWYTYYHQAFFR
jgi:sterol 3beta-glucosyltransferase